MSDHDVIARASAVFTPDKSTVQCSPQLPLPGVVILVHGVNSDGEWYEATEQGLCAGLNTRLARQPEQMFVKGVPGGQLTPASYRPELTDQGFLDRERTAKTFITPEPNYSPVIRFRWGYKADEESLQKVGQGVWLNEASYWGGGPFANGCTSLPDLWGDGLNDRLFLWLRAQDLNPEPGRDVYACPSRHYYAFAARRLAELVKLIRSKQADVPITIVCHSQGNMIGLGAAFYGAQIGEVRDGNGKAAPAVADNYVLANAPYSLAEVDMGTDNWSQRYVVNQHGQSGRQTGRARVDTLANFFELIRARQDTDQPVDEVSRWSANENPLDGSPGYKVAEDRERYTKKGRVTLYCNPHDRVISALTVQGIGWRGLEKAEIYATEGKGVFVQRVWAQGHPVGKKVDYRYLDGKTADKFWLPESRTAKFNLVRTLTDPGNSVVAKFFTLVTAPVVWIAILASSKIEKLKVRINAVPLADWVIPIDAPALPHDYLPQAQRLGQPTAFDQGMDPDTDLLKAKAPEAPVKAGDPYDTYRPVKTAGPEAGSQTDDGQNEARLRYEHRARLRMADYRRGGNGQEAKKADDEASPEWREWSRPQITNFLKESLDQHATDHSTIMTCAENLEKVLAYDVPVGLSRLTEEDWDELRVAADWQLGGELKKDHPLAKFGYYFEKGLWKGDKPLHEHPDFKYDAEHPLPTGITDERSNAPAPRPGDYA